MAKIFLFRHGQTTYNRDGILTGWEDPDLTDNGIKECLEIAKQLKDEIPTKAYASDLKRSQHTLSLALGDKKNKITIVIDPRIKERDYGDLNGRNKENVKKEYPEKYPLWHRSYDVPPPNGESIKDVEKRVNAFLDDLVAKLDSNDVVFISAHGNSLRPIRRYFEKMSIEEMCSFEHTPAKVYEYIV